MKKLLCAVLAAAMLCGCTAAPAGATTPETVMEDSGTVRIRLGDGSLTVTAPDGMAENAVTTANDIICYEAGHGEDYGEGEEWEAHTAEEVARHTVLHINAPGTYVLSGKLPAGQIAVDLGENAKDDPNAVVTLVLDSVDITCTVAPAIIFYNVYESGDPEAPTAGANVILADGSVNNIVGSHVAKIYQPGTDKKLHKYDAAFYSRMSLNVGGTGALNITADNEGLDSELHLTINSGDISIESGNDGINTNADGASVTTINGGHLRITVTGETGEGDGIDSNGWLVINGGTVEAYACAASGDSGIDSDMGIRINGGTVIATGNMLDRIEEGGQTHAVFTFAESQTGRVYTLKDSAGTSILDAATPNRFTNLIFSSPKLQEGIYSLWSGDTRFLGMVGSNDGFGFGDGRVEIPPQPTQPVVTHGTVRPADGETPENMPVPDFPREEHDRMPAGPMPQEGENMPVPQLPEGVDPPEDGFGRKPVQIVTGTLSADFPIRKGANSFMQVKPAA